MQKQTTFISDLQSRLFTMQDLQYRDFHSKLAPNIDKDTIIGIRTPILRKFAKEFSQTSEAENFLKELPHKYYEENNLHAFLIENMADYDEAICALDEFLPYVNNWATCDSMRPKSFAKHLSELNCKIREWVKSKDTYTVRFGIEMMMTFYLDELFNEEYLALVASVKSEEYYVKMMIAWYFATALAKQYESALPFITGRRLDEWTHNKVICKAVESYRITDDQKIYLRTLKVKLEKNNGVQQE